jgi:hypothetical protein
VVYAAGHDSVGTDQPAIDSGLASNRLNLLFECC